MPETARKDIRRRPPLPVIMVAVGLFVTACSSGRSEPPTTPSSTSGGTPTASSAGTAPATGTTGSSTPTPSPSEAPPLGSPVNQQLWPFGTLAQARAWEQSYAAGGQQPWHLDAAATALAFTQGYLGFSGIDKATSTVVSGRDAHVGVGYTTPSTPPGTGTAAVIHLVRYGPDPTAPWEVVGTADTTLTLTTPAYGATATSPVTVGGRITGVDESITVQIRQLSSADPLGTRAGLPAGGDNTPWSTSVTFTSASDPVLTVVASTGGHLRAVERFAITAVRRG